MRLGAADVKGSREVLDDLIFQPSDARCTLVNGHGSIWRSDGELLVLCGGRGSSMVACESDGSVSGRT